MRNTHTPDCNQWNEIDWSFSQITASAHSAISGAHYMDEDRVCVCVFGALINYRWSVISNWTQQLRSSAINTHLKLLSETRCSLRNKTRTEESYIITSRIWTKIHICSVIETRATANSSKQMWACPVTSGGWEKYANEERLSTNRSEARQRSSNVWSFDGNTFTE